MIPIRYMAHAWAPKFLREGQDGSRYMYALETAIDASLERTFQSVAALFPSQCDDSVLPEHAHDCQLLRGNEESEAAFRLRCRYHRTMWRLAGHAYSILMALGGYLAPHAVRIKIVTNAGMWYERAADGTMSWSQSHLGTWNWDTQPAEWARFWVIIYPPSTLWTAAPAVGAGPWDLTASKAQVKDIRRLIEQLKPLHMQCEWIVVALDPASFDETAVLEPDGDWQHWSIGSAPRAANRLGTARYWRGQEVYT